MSDLDLAQFLRDWPHEPGRLNVRLVEGRDGRPKVQVRVELGVLQMETSGRPDGSEPEGHDTLLAACEDRLREQGEDDFVLPPRDCRALREEALQFHHRHMALFVLDQHDLVVRDVEHSLKVIEFLRRFAETEEDARKLDPFVPHLAMMRARSLASAAVASRDPRAALAALDRGLDDLRRVFRDLGIPERFDAANETQLLRGMREALVPKLPVSQRVELQDRIQRALEAENYELAAILRDELRILDQNSRPG